MDNNDNGILPSQGVNINSTITVNGTTYQDDYQSFMVQYRFQDTHPEEIGMMIVRMADYFMRHNLILARSLKVYNQVCRDIAGQIDSATGKSMTSTKAEVIASATPECAAYQEAKAHVENIEQCINALKALQKGRTFEYLHQ